MAALALAAAFLFQGLATPAAAQTYTVTVNTDMDLGRVSSGATGDSVFRIDPSAGSVTQISGTATRITTGTTRAMVTISCAAVGPTDCTKPMRVLIGSAGTPTNRERALSRVTFALGTAVLSGSPGSPTSGSFTIAAIGANSSKTFFLGADMTVAGDDSGLTTGDSVANFFVYTAETPTTPTTGAIGNARVRVLRSMTLAKNSDMVFGNIIKPATGSGTVSIDAATSALTLTGGMSNTVPPTPTRASFTVTGEGGQAFTLTIPASFQMTGPGTPLTVTITKTASGAQTLSSALGSAGTFNFGVGGSFPVSSTTTNGAYTGNFTVSVIYN